MGAMPGFSDIQSACRDQKPPRGMSRASLPITSATPIRDPDAADAGASTSSDHQGAVTAFLVEGLLVVLDPTHAGPVDGIGAYDDIVDSARAVVDAATEVEKSDDKGDDDDVKDDDDDVKAEEEQEKGEEEGEEDEKNDEEEGERLPPFDTMVWTKAGDDSASGAVSATFEGGRVFIQVAKDDITAEMVCDLVTMAYKALVLPFEDTPGGRDAWKLAQRPRLSRSYAEDASTFKLSFEKRLNTIFEGVDKRAQTAFDSVYATKVLSAARGVVGRFARKHELEATWKKPKESTGEGEGEGEGEGAKAKSKSKSKAKAKAKAKVGAAGEDGDEV